MMTAAQDMGLGRGHFFKGSQGLLGALFLMIPRIAFSSTMVMIAPASTHSPSSAETMVAAINNMTMKLSNCSQSSLRNVPRGASINWLGPYCARRLAT